MRLILTTLLLVAGCSMQPAKLTPNISAMTPPMPVQSTTKPIVVRTVSYDEMAPVSYKPMSAVITPKLPPCPPLHWEASNGWGGIVISGPDLIVLDWNHTGCPQYPNVCTARAWLIETTDYVLPVQTSGQEFARIIPFETE